MERMKRYAHKGIAAKLTVLFLSFLLPLCACRTTPTPTTRTGFAMGSLLTARIYTNADTAESMADSILKEVQMIDACISATDPASEISALNRGESVSLSADTLELLQNTLDLCGKLNGKLDITLGAVTDLWGFTGDTPRVPDADMLAAALATKDPDGVTFDGSTVTLAKGQMLDFGAVGKGVACDVACQVIDANYVVPAVVSFGGTVLCYGQKADGPWTVGVRDPFGPADSYCATIEFTPEWEMDCLFVSTSGSYEKTFTEDGKTYHHIIDPDTGYPVETDLVSVTAVGSGGFVCDALSTALFVNGLNEESLTWVDMYLYGAAFIFEDGGIYVTHGLRDTFQLTDVINFHYIDDEAF